MKRDSNVSQALLKATVDRLFLLSESRGKEAAGVSILSGGSIVVYKQPSSASLLIKAKEYNRLFEDRNADQRFPNVVMGHARLVTNGSLEMNENNQPVVKDGLVGIHNGIIVNDAELWAAFPSLKKEYEVDTEVLLALISMFVKQGYALDEAAQETFRNIKGSASIGVLCAGKRDFLLATNTGSLYICQSKENHIFLFASERYILETLLNHLSLQKVVGAYELTQLKPGFGCLINMDTLQEKTFSLLKEGVSLREQQENNEPPFKIVDRSSYSSPALNVGSPAVQEHVKAEFMRITAPIASLRRCAKCILPETMPFIEFDEYGVCNFCNSFQAPQWRERELLEERIAPFRNSSGKPDCIVAFSGGRDSSYGLHYIKSVLGMNPIAYCYDWGMITDLARRNQARICGKLGVEYILVSADIRKKRAHIRKNITAWLKTPNLGTVPLFMAGDKHFFYYANRLRKQTGVNLIVFCVNPLEKTHFKSGFAGVRPTEISEGGIYALSPSKRMKLALYYAYQFMQNQSFLNSSLWDTFTGYLSFYFIPHEYLFLYDYIPWDEREIDSTLKQEYEWETAKDSHSTWRVGDGTAPFYNYIYYVLAGFTENDTFRSNQIRLGVMSREEALLRAQKENEPRYDSIHWYCNVIGLDINHVLKVIHSAPRRYETI